MITGLLPQPKAVTQARVVDGVQQLTVAATDRGYEPSIMIAQAGMPIQLTMETNRTFGCSRAFVIPSLDVQEILPETGQVPLQLPSQAEGQIRFTCAMGMYTGVIIIQ